MIGKMLDSIEVDVDHSTPTVHTHRGSRRQTCSWNARQKAKFPGAATYGSTEPPGDVGANAVVVAAAGVLLNVDGAGANVVAGTVT